MNTRSRARAVDPLRRSGKSGARLRLTIKLSLGCAGLALLSACAGSNKQADSGYSTSYYIAHAAGNYKPPGPASDPWGPYINIASSRFDVPGPWIRQVMHVESGGQEYMNGGLTVSPAGAMGLMQLEPETYQEMAARYGLGSDPFNPYDNIMAGAAYIHEMYEVYGSPGFLAAYNAGPGRLDSFMNYNRPLPHETTNYVAMIAPQIQGYYPKSRSNADQLALNTEPSGVSTGILPAGFSPNGPATSPAYAYQDTAPQQPMPSPAPAPAPVQVAMISPPVATPEPEASAVYTQTALSVPETAPPPAPPPAQPVQRHTFSIIPSAIADTPPPQQQMASYTPTGAGAGHHGWAIQVGAYDTSKNANAALGIAELSAVQMLVHGHPMVMSVSSGNGTKYRARVVDLPHQDAVNACERLSHGPTGCVVLSPEAQS